jgi:hypothetical protein
MTSALIAGVVALTLATSTGMASSGDCSSGLLAANDLQNPARTAKERLVNKASDEQRINNCKVPLALRGPRPRPDACRTGTGAAPSQ